MALASRLMYAHSLLETVPLSLNMAGTSVSDNGVIRFQSTYVSICRERERERWHSCLSYYTLPGSLKLYKDSHAFNSCALSELFLSYAPIAETRDREGELYCVSKGWG
jgi:hypothetical protein